MLMLMMVNSAASDLPAQIVPQVDYHYYPVTIQNQANIEAATDTAKPSVLAGSPKSSRTDWRIDYTFNSVRKYGNNCQVSNYDINVVCSITLPDYKSGDPLLAYRLKSYVERLKVHELRHCDIVKEHADKFEDWLDSIRYYNCGEIMNSVRRQYDIYIRQCERAHIQYDQATDYGKRDGAHLDLLLPQLKEKSGRAHNNDATGAGENNTPALGDNESGAQEKPETSGESPEPMSKYYKDKDGVWRNDAR